MLPKNEARTRSVPVPRVCRTTTQTDASWRRFLIKLVINGRLACNITDLGQDPRTTICILCTCLSCLFPPPTSHQNYCSDLFILMMAIIIAEFLSLLYQWRSLGENVLCQPHWGNSPTTSSPLSPTTISNAARLIPSTCSRCSLDQFAHMAGILGGDRVPINTYQSTPIMHGQLKQRHTAKGKWCFIVPLDSKSGQRSSWVQSVSIEEGGMNGDPSEAGHNRGL